MKKVKRLIKLTNLNSENLNEKELSCALGGECLCGCFWAACGGSSNIDNSSANSTNGFYSKLPPVGVDCGVLPS